jgi:hypothetical protein
MSVETDGQTADSANSAQNAADIGGDERLAASL